jgi:hypothetical protein
VELTGARPEERRVAPVVGLVGTRRRGEARGQSSGARVERRGGERRWRLPVWHRTGWRRGWGRRRVIGGDAAAHDLRGGQRRAVSGGRLDGGHGGAAAYLGNGEGDGSVAHSDKHGRKRSSGFGHELSGRRARRGERPAVGVGSGGRKWTQRIWTVPLRCGMRAGAVLAREAAADRWAPHVSDF